jgi:trans-2,3-dihydro-3-hydroxyanthranilate isomerase
MNLRYLLFDVFTDEFFGGNPLAVFPEAEGIPADLMQKIAFELNLSETTFVLPPQDSSNHFRVRIFTPRSELPMAGHPTVGTAFALLKEGRIQVDGSKALVRFEEGVGPIPVSISNAHESFPHITMTQPPPEFGPNYTNRERIAAMLSIQPSELHNHLPAKAVSTGVPFLFVPVRDLATIEKLKLRPDMLDDPDLPSKLIFAFTLETTRKGSTVHGRMFAPTLGIAEDPATGGAAGPLGCYLVQHDIVNADQAKRIIVEQGFEMGRPSILHVSISRTDGLIDVVNVGGTCVATGEGKFLMKKL